MFDHFTADDDVHRIVIEGESFTEFLFNKRELESFRCSVFRKVKRRKVQVQTEIVFNASSRESIAIKELPAS